MDDPQWTTEARAKGLYNVVVMGVAFFMLFSAYNTLQNYATSLFPGNLGNNSLAVLYLSVCVVLPFAPWVVKRVGEKWSMVGGAFLYVVYMLSILHIVVPVVLCTSFVIGAGAAVLWVAQGSYLTINSSDDTRGRNAGIFWGLLQTSNVLGNAAAFFVFNEVSEEALFLLFCGLGAVGVVIILFLGPGPHAITVVYNADLSSEAQTPRSGSQTPALERSRLLDNDGITTARVTVDTAFYGSADVSAQRGEEALDRELLAEPRMNGATSPHLDDAVLQSPATLMWKALLLFREKHILLLLPTFFLTGYELAFWTGEFPKTLDTGVIGLVLMFNGFGEIAGGVVMGYLSDRALGRSWTMLTGTILYCSSLYLIAVLHDHSSGTHHTSSPAPCPCLHSTSWMAYVAAVGFGLGDSCFNIQVFAILGHLFPSNSVAAFTVFQLLQNIGSAIGFYSSPKVPVHGSHGGFTQLWLQAGVLLASLVGFCIVDRLTRDPPAEQDSTSTAATGKHHKALVTH